MKSKICILNVNSHYRVLRYYVIHTKTELKGTGENPFNTPFKSFLDRLPF